VSKQLPHCNLHRIFRIFRGRTGPSCKPLQVWLANGQEIRNGCLIALAGSLDELRFGTKHFIYPDYLSR
jgi:hypothetical protein